MSRTDDAVFYGVLAGEGSCGVGPDPASVFADPGLFKGFFFPLISVDLSSCTTDLEGTVHFVYCEYSESNNGAACGLSFQLDDQDRYSVVPSSLAEFERFKDEVELPECPFPSSWKAEASDTRVFSDGTPTDSVDSLRRVIRQNDSAANGSGFPVFGAAPSWRQSPAQPRDPSGKKMRFIGQLNASAFTLEAAAFELLLFYSPEHRLVTQFCQAS